MTPDQVLTIREAFTAAVGRHVSQDDFAHAIGLTPNNGGERVREFEDGKRETTGPVDRVLEYLSQSVQTRFIPEYVLGDDDDTRTRARDYWFLIRLYWPRFVARIDTEESILRGTGLPFHEFERGHFFTVLQWIDDPELLGRQRQSCIDHAVAHFKRHVALYHL